MVSDIAYQLQNTDGDAIISVKDEHTPFSKCAALLDVFVPFELNRKKLVTGIISALEKQANAAESFQNTAKVLAQVEAWLDDLAFEFPCDIVFSNVSASSLIKACAPEIRPAGDSLAEQVLDYLELLYEFDRPRLVFTLNMRAFVPYQDMCAFARDCVGHGYHVLALECREYPLLPNEKRVIVDDDLCVIS